jgi:hypothetical protein
MGKQGADGAKDIVTRSIKNAVGSESSSNRKYVYLSRVVEGLLNEAFVFPDCLVRGRV